VREGVRSAVREGWIGRRRAWRRLSADGTVDVPFYAKEARDTRI
jgi:hypothetical protein